MSYKVENHGDVNTIINTNGFIILVIKNDKDAEYLCQLFNRGVLVMRPEPHEEPSETSE